MGSQSLHTLARRGVDIAKAIVTSEEPGKEIVVQISPLAGLMFLLTLLAFIFVMFTVTYTYGHIIPTLCMIESPETNAYVPVQTISNPDQPPAYTEDDDDGLPKPNDPEVLLITNQPITESIRATVLHLKARGGYWSRFRGLGLFIIWGFLRNLIIGFMSLGSRNPITVSVVAIIAEVALAHVHMTWIHVVISEPSEKKWYQRIPTLRGNWVKIAPAVLLWSVVTQIVHIMPMLMVGSWGVLRDIQNPDFQPGAKHIYITASQLFMAMILTLAMFILLEIPAAVTLVRVAASMLPEEDETIVPFDRSFGGQVTPSIIGGQGKIGLVEAWRSFPWQSRKRLLKLCVKVAAIVVAVWFSFSIVLVAEAHAMIGPDGWNDIMKAIHSCSWTTVDIKRYDNGECYTRVGW